MTELEKITELDRLCEAFKEVRSVSSWKASTHRYEADVIMNSLKLQEEVRNGTYKQSAMLNFTLNERGKLRDIHAPAVRDRVVQKTVNQDILLPCLRKYLIYDNAASLEMRGTAFMRKRHLIHLRNFIRENGTDGYILQVDIRHYFDSVDHEICWKMIEPRIPESTRPLVHYIIDNASESDKGLNLGSEVPQTLAIYYLHPVDDYCKIVEGIKGYGRYMDDIYIFGKSKEELWRILDGIKKQLVPLKLEVNEKKTQIVKLSHGYTFMQLKYRILENGKVLVTPAPAKITRERRKLKAYKRLYDEGRLDEVDILNAYKSWRQSILRDCTCTRSVENLDRLYEELFGTSPHRKPKNEETRYSIPDAPGEKHFIISDTPFTRRIGANI
ncbi:MAG: hypothetical protein IJ711_00290 [Lachnospiraceae bacterium]|nr:hypothetical protein [Clostridia bacterium]MBR1691194.1 hypothetical protein [Lachnospiraceae bacterium]